MQKFKAPIFDRVPGHSKGSNFLWNLIRKSGFNFQEPAKLYDQGYGWNTAGSLSFILQKQFEIILFFKNLKYTAKKLFLESMTERERLHKSSDLRSNHAVSNGPKLGNFDDWLLRSEAGSKIRMVVMGMRYFQEI